MRPASGRGKVGVMDHATAKDLLTARRAELVLELERVDSDLDSARSAKTDGTDDDEHDPEGATTSTQWSHATGMRRSVLSQIDEVDLALARVRQGAYGTCTRCGRAISDGRLEARPAAALCISCARELSA